MAEFQDYARIAQEVKAVQWDGTNETYETIATELPNKFMFERPTNTLSLIGSRASRTSNAIAIGKWIIVGGEPKDYIILSDAEFRANYEEKVVATAVNTLKLPNL